MPRCKAYFDILNRVSVTHECDRQTDRQTDGPTDIFVAKNAAFNYVAQPNMRNMLNLYLFILQFSFQGLKLHFATSLD